MSDAATTGAPMRTAPRRRWYRRHPVLSVLLALLVVVVLVVGVLVGRALLVLASIGPRAEYWEQQAERPGDVTYVALGDSLSQGIGSSSPQTSFVGVLADDLRGRIKGRLRVVNLSVTGATAQELVDDQLPAFEDLLAALQAEGRGPALVTLVIGANDSGSTPPEEFRGHVETILDTLPAGSYVGDVPDFNGGPRLESAAALSEVVREEVSERPELVLVPLEAATGDLTVREYAGDFFHPSDRGYLRYVIAFRAAIVAVEGPAVAAATAVEGADQGAAVTEDVG